MADYQTLPGGLDCRACDGAGFDDEGDECISCDGTGSDNEPDKEYDPDEDTDA